MRFGELRGRTGWEPWGWWWKGYQWRYDLDRGFAALLCIGLRMASSLVDLYEGTLEHEY